MSYNNFNMLLNKIAVPRIKPSINSNQGTNWAFDNFFVLSFYIYFAELYVLLSCLRLGFPQLKKGEIESVFELNLFGNYYLNSIQPHYLKNFPNIPEIEALEIFLKQLSSFRGALEETDPLIVKNAQQYFKHVMIPLLIFITDRFDSVSVNDTAISLFVPDFQEIVNEGRNAEKDKNYPNRESLLRNYNQTFQKYTTANFYYQFFTDFYPQTLHFVQVKYKELYEKFLIDFQIEEKFPAFVRDSYIQPPLTLFQLENFISLFLFYRKNCYTFSTTGLNLSIWDVHSMFYYNFNYQAPVYDYLKFHYFSKIFIKIYDNLYHFRKVFFFRPIRHSQLCDFLVLAYPDFSSNYKIFAFDVNLHDVPEYKEMIKKRDFSDKIFLSQLKNNNISQFIIVDVKGVETTHRVVDIL